MAEQVQAALDQMVAPLRDLMDRNIFSEKEVKAIVARRRESEYLLRRRAARKKDFLVYIEDEHKLERLRQLRTHQRKRDHRKSQEESEEKPTQHIGDTHIVQHIHLLFVRAIRKFRSDLSLHLAHVDFCKAQKSWTSLGRVYAEALQIFPRQTGLWIEAAQHEFFGPHRSIRSARILLQRGLRINATSQDLWVEYFALEMHYAQTLKGRKQILMDGSNDTMELDEPNDEYKIAVIVYRNAVKTIPDSIPFRLRFMDTCRRFPNTQEIMEMIQEPLKEDFATRPEAWITRALYEAEKYSNAANGDSNVTLMEQSLADQEEDEAATNEDRVSDRRPAKKSRKKDPVVAVLEEGMQVLSSADMKLQAFRFAKEYQESRHQAGDTIAAHQAQELMDNILEDADEHTSPELALEQVDHFLSLNKTEKAIQVLQLFCESRETVSASVWIRWASLSGDDAAEAILRKATRRIPMDHPEHMSVLLQYFGSMLRDTENNLEQLQNVFQQIVLLAPSAKELVVEGVEGTSFGIESIYHAYCKYLSYVAKLFGIKAARKVYQCVLFQSNLSVNETSVAYLKEFIDMSLMLEKANRAHSLRLFDKVLDLFHDTPLEKEYRLQRSDYAVFG
eukprot:Nitzschia sp. Nitz4//scaffold91_size79674//19895//21748//NITZ4_005357-RA/size79674-processed-gene-0.89-mRNA-1//1//CDS//3329560070//2815//frame0